MADREKKEGKTEIHKLEYLHNEKSSLDEIKSIFCNYLRAAIWRKKWKIVDTNFKDYVRYISACLLCMSKIERF